MSILSILHNLRDTRTIFKVYDLKCFYPHDLHSRGILQVTHFLKVKYRL